MAYFNNIDNEIIYKLGTLAEKYIQEDSNSSMIKQGMILEYICNLYLTTSGQIKKIKTKDKYPPSLNEMLDYLYMKKSIPSDSVGFELCEKIRVNRNKAAHSLYESSISAYNTIKGLSELCKAFVDKINRITQPNKNITWSSRGSHVNEPKPDYNNNPIPELMDEFKSVFEEFKLSEEASNQLNASYPPTIYNFD